MCGCGPSYSYEALDYLRLRKIFFLFPPFWRMVRASGPGGAKSRRALLGRVGLRRDAARVASPETICSAICLNVVFDERRATVVWRSCSYFINEGYRARGADAALLMRRKHSAGPKMRNFVREGASLEIRQHHPPLHYVRWTAATSRQG